MWHPECLITCIYTVCIWLKGYHDLVLYDYSRPYWLKCLLYFSNLSVYFVLQKAGSSIQIRLMVFWLICFMLIWTLGQMLYSWYMKHIETVWCGYVSLCGLSIKLIPVICLKNVLYKKWKHKERAKTRVWLCRKHCLLIFAGFHVKYLNN